MEDNMLLILPENLQRNLQNIKHLEQEGWSREWNDQAMSILFELNNLRDAGTITEEQYRYVHKNYLKLIGSIGENSDDFFWFLCTCKV